MEQDIRVIPTTGRNNCGGRCIIKAHVKDGTIVRLTTDTPEEADGGVPLTACARGMNYHTTYLSEDRLKYPMKRVGKRGAGEFERISWDEAVDILVREWTRIRDTYGPGSRYVMYATGESAVLSGRAFTKRLLSLDGGFLDSYNSYSSACVRQITPYLYGTDDTASSPADWLNSSLIVLWGHNPAETVFDAETMFYLRKARDRGIPMIGIDPRENDTIRRLGAEWFPIRPATDSALADAIAWVLYIEGLYDKAFIDRCCLGFDREHMPEGIDPDECYFSYLTGVKDGVEKTPEWAEKITGLPAERIFALARRMGTVKPLNILQGWGPQRNAYGEQASRSAIMLACLTGNVGIPGGSACGPGGYNPRPLPKLPPLPNPYGVSIPVFLWTDAVTRGTEMTALDGVRGAGHLSSNIKMIFNIAGNTLLNQHADVNRTKAILEDESLVEFIVVSDVFLTASARYADLLLPCTSFWEEENMTLPWIGGAFIGYNNRVIDPLYECRPEYDWLKEAARRLGLYDAFTQGRETARDWLRFLYDRTREESPELPAFDELRRTGIVRYKNVPVRVAFARECRDPEHCPFPTPSGKIEIFSRTLYEKEFSEFFPAIPRYVSPPEGYEDPLRAKYPLQLMGYHTKRRCHSIHDNNPRLERLDPQAVWMNPLDAADRGIGDGDMAVVFNDRGRLRLPVRVTERIMPGVAAIPQGAWYRPEADGTDAGGNINVLTSQRPTPLAHGNGQHTNLAEIRKA